MPMQKSGLNNALMVWEIYHGMKTASTMVIFIRKKPKSFIPFREVVSTATEAPLAMLPNMVSSPACILKTFALPLATLVPPRAVLLFRALFTHQ